MSVLNIAVVGLGSKNTSRARDYLATINKLNHMYKIVSLCDQNQDVLNEIGGKYEVKFLYQDAYRWLANTNFGLDRIRNHALVCADLPQHYYRSPVDRTRKTGLSHCSVAAANGSK